MPKIHDSAIVEKSVQLGDDVEVGPGCVLSGDVSIGRGSRLIGHVYIHGPVRIGERAQIYPFACIGFPGQDLKFKLGDPTPGVVIGADALLREHVTIHAATKLDAPTTVGDRVFMMVNTHLGHDARVGSGVVMVNNSAIGGHAQLHDGCTLGGASVVHQFARVGRLAFVGGGCACSGEVPPYCLVSGHHNLTGINLVGCRRSGMAREHIERLRDAFRAAFWEGRTKPEIVAALTEMGRDCPPVADMARFVAEARRPIMACNRRRDLAQDAADC